MNLHLLHTQDPLKTVADCLVVGIEQEAPLSGTAKLVDMASGGLIRRILAAKDFLGIEGTSHMLHEVQGVTPKRVMLLGLGKKSADISSTQRLKHCKKALSALGSALKASPLTQIIIAATELATTSEGAQWTLTHGLVTLERAMNEYPALRQTSKKALPPKTFHWRTSKAIHGDRAQACLVRGAAMAFGMEKMLLVANHPANICTPAAFASFAEAFVKELIKHDKKTPLSINVLKPDQLKKLGMHSFLGVAKGSDEPARLVEIVYRGSEWATEAVVRGQSKKSAQSPVVLVGKGVTFDSGGISLKPGAEMDHMKWDMCGAASVLGTLLACAKMRLPIDVVGITPMCENMPSGKASKPSDVVRTMSGLTVENLNTDAEGRLILCDALTYAQKNYQARALIDVATLTGACVIALGDIRMGLYSNNDELGLLLKNAGDQALDPAWPMPTDDEYLEGMKSNFADIANISGRSGGSVTAAKFLSKFINKETLWAHLDIAGVAYVGNGKEKGATGRPMALLMQYLMGIAK
jgi:leucyl aminopeptidase